MSSLSQFTANNYLVPASGRVHGVSYKNDFGGVQSTDSVDWGSYKVNNFPFIPQGAFIDNTQGTGDLTIYIEEIQYTIFVPQGISKQSQFPALDRSTMTITGTGQVSIFFVDFPVLPDSGLVNIGNTVSVNLSSYSFAGALPVLPSINNQGIPYQITKIRPQGEFKQAQITGSALTASLTPSASGFLQRLKIYVPDDVKIGTAGENLITISVGALVIQQFGIYLDTTTALRSPHAFDVEFDDLKAGNAGDVVTVTIGTVLTGGTIFVNGYFSGV